MLLLPERDLAAATTLGDALRREVEAAGMLHGNSLVSPWVTVSVGVSSVRPQADGDPEFLIEAADRALYDAKAQGRNCVVARPAA